MTLPLLLAACYHAISGGALDNVKRQRMWWQKEECNASGFFNYAYNIKNKIA